MVIGEIIRLLRADHYYGGGEYIEIAKGKNQLVTNFKGFMRKAKRIWQQKKILK